MSLTHPARRGWPAFVATLALLVTTACSDDPGRADTESLSDATAAAGAAEQPPAAPSEPAAGRTEPSGVDVRSEVAPAEDPQREPLASLTVPISYVDGGELDMAVDSVQVAGELMRVSMTFTAHLPSGSEPVALGAILVGDETFPATGITPEVIDPVNLKAYEVVAGDVPNGESVDLESDVPQTLVFYYAAPQDDMDTIDVVLSSQMRPITDVPVSP